MYAVALSTVGPDVQHVPVPPHYQPYYSFHLSHIIASIMLIPDHLALFPADNNLSTSVLVTRLYIRQFRHNRSQVDDLHKMLDVVVVLGDDFVFVAILTVKLLLCRVILA